MKISYTSVIGMVISFLISYSVIKVNATQVVQPAYTSTAGNAAFLGPLANSSRTYQLLINENQLTGLIGNNLTAISWRSLSSATTVWPSANITFSSYKIYLSASVTPSARSFTFAQNIAGPQTLVRSGSLSVDSGTYTFGSSPNQFGPEITFNTPYLYTGGHLLIEIRQSGFSGTSRSIDALGTSTSGYGTNFSACWKSSDTGTVAALQGNFSVVRISGTPAPTLKLTALIEGRYYDMTNLMVSDTTKVYVQSATSPYPIVDSARSVLDVNGKGVFYFGNAANAVNYFIVVNHRNSIETWSALPQSFSSDSLSYDFTTAATTAYGNNQELVGSRWTMFSGDINRDGYIDLTDLSIASNDASAFVSGYVLSDVNGDLITDLTDVLIIYENSSKFVEVAKP